MVSAGIEELGFQWFSAYAFFILFHEKFDIWMIGRYRIIYMYQTGDISIRHGDMDWWND